MTVEAAVRVRAEPRLSVTVRPDGRLEMYWPSGSRAFTCDAAGTAAWIALQQTGWRLDNAAERLAGIWRTNIEECRLLLDEWFERFHAAGLLVIDW